MTVLIDRRCSVLLSTPLVIDPTPRPSDFRLASKVLPAGPPPTAALCAACLIAAVEGGGGGRSRAATSPLYVARWPRGRVTERRWHEDGVYDVVDGDGDATVAAESSLQQGLLAP